MPKPEGIPTARMQFKLDPDRIPWVFASLANTPSVLLYKGGFPDPFTGLIYQAQLNQGQLILAAQLTLGPEFQRRYGDTVGSPEDLDSFLRRYSRCQFDPECHQLVIFDDGQVQGMIVRPKEDVIVIQRGGQAGQLTLGEDPINNLGLHLDRFGVFVQRYVASIWNASPETDQRRFSLILGIPQLPDGAPRTYFSTFEIIAKDFRARPRPVDLEADIGGHPDSKALMRSVIMDMTSPETSRNFGTQPFSNRFVLGWGREGTGKSLYPKALDMRLRAVYGDRLEHYRIGFTDLLSQRGSFSGTVVKTILDHIRENEIKKIPTLLHLDNLEQLIPPTLRQRTRAGNLFSLQDHRFAVMSDAEFQWSTEVLGPVIQVIRDFGLDLGGECHNIIVFGESRVPRDELPEGIARTFRRTVSLDDPTPADLADILRVQIAITRKFAERSKRDPFVEGIDLRLADLTRHGTGLVGRDIQQALIHIADLHKAGWDGQAYTPVTYEEITNALDTIRSERNIQSTSGTRTGFLALLGRA